MKQLLLFLLLFASSVVFAEDDAQDRLKQLEADLNGVRQEQQSLFQNFQLIRELRLIEAQAGIPPTSGYPYGKDIYGTDIQMSPPNYDDVMRAQLEREQRIRQYTDDLKNMSERYLELEEERKTLFEQIRALKQQRDE